MNADRPRGLRGHAALLYPAAMLGVFSGSAVAQESERPAPPADGDYQWVSTYRLEELNRRIEAIGRDLGVDVIGFHDALEDPGRPGVMAPRLTADGDPPSIAGYRLLGARVADALAR